MKENFIWIFLIFFILTSCDNRTLANFEITNKARIQIDSLKIEPNVIDDAKYISLKPNEIATYKADMTGIPKFDGSYQLSYHQDGEIVIKNFGYYSNGYPSEQLIHIKIEKDSLLIDSDFGNY